MIQRKKSEIKEKYGIERASIFLGIFQKLSQN